MSDPTSYYPAAIALAVLGGITALLDMPPLFWHIRNRNIGAASIITWVLLLNLMKVPNVILWGNDDMKSWWTGIYLCDVEIRIQIGAYVGITTALLCCMKGLAKVMNTKAAVVTVSKSERRKGYVADLILCVGLPLWFMLAYYINQPTRYLLYGIDGCRWSLDDSWLASLLLLIWPIIFTLIVLYYTGKSMTLVSLPYELYPLTAKVLVIYRLYTYRRDFSRLLEANSTTRSRFLRLLTLSLSVILFVLPINIYGSVLNLLINVHPYSWTRTHTDFNQIVMVPSLGVVRWDKWMQIAGGFVVFLLFGLGTDAVKMYKGWLASLGFNKLVPGLHQASGATNTTAPRNFKPLSTLSTARSAKTMASLITTKNSNRTVSDTSAS